MGSDLRHASKQFGRMVDAHQLPTEFDFLYEVGTHDNTTYYDYIEYRYTTELGYYRLPDGTSGRAYSTAPIIDWMGRPNGPMQFYKGSMAGNAYSDLDIYAHEVLHRNPQFARQFVNLQNSAQLDILHHQMQIAIDKLVNTAKANGYGR